MTFIKILLITVILLVIAFSGIFIKMFFAKEGSNKNSSRNNSISDQGVGCGCGSGACCKTA